MYGREVQPPTAAKWLLDLFTPYEEAESIHGDLLEEFASLAVAKGPRDARRWYWRQCLKSVVHLFAGAFRRSPWTLVGAIVIGQLSLSLGWSLPEEAIFGTLHLVRNHVTPFHADWYSYVMWLNYGILVGRLLQCFVIGLLVACIAKGGELVATICVGFPILGNVLPHYFLMAILAFARYPYPNLHHNHVHPALVSMLLNMVQFPMMIVLGGWVVRDMRVARLRSRFTRNILNSA